jgi:hypothetical protein
LLLSFVLEPNCYRKDEFDMNIDGTVQISIKDFETLRNKAKWFEEIRSELRSCTTVEVKEVNEDEYIQVINVDAEKVSKLTAKYSDCEEIFEDDEINLVNFEKMTV